MKIPFNTPFMTGKEIYYIAKAHFNGQLSGDGPYTQLCHNWLQTNTQCLKGLLTHSCTAALEMAALLLDIKPGDEIIMPSYTFVSTANAFVLRGGIPVFIDIREDTLNLNEKLIESAITSRTRAIVAVHYAGVSCDMDYIIDVAKKYDLRIIEDAAQGIMAKYKGRTLGGIGDMGTYSFHETKNVISGEGGALLINDPKLTQFAEIIREKGTDRSRFIRGEIDKYTWQEMGSSFLPGELTAAFLWAQLEEAASITKKKISKWNYYHEMLHPLEKTGMIRRPIVPNECEHNGHLYYIIFSEPQKQKLAITNFKRHQISALTHYVPLHSSPAGLKYCKTHGSLGMTDYYADTLLRLPLWCDISKDEQDNVIELLMK